MKAIENLFASIIEEAAAEAERRVMAQIQDISSPVDKVLNTQEAAEYLGISLRTLYTLCAEKQIRHIPAGAIGSRKPVFLFRMSTLNAWLREREEKSIERG